MQTIIVIVLGNGTKILIRGQLLYQLLQLHFHTKHGAMALRDTKS